MIRARASVVALLLAAAACGDDAGAPEGAFTVRLSRALGTTTGDVVVTASQPGVAPRALTMRDPFRDCDSNQLRIIPRSASEPGEPIPEVTIHVRATAGVALETVEVVAVPAPSPIDIVLGSGGPLEPLGCVTQPDGGSAIGSDGGIADADAAMPKRPVGAACDNGSQCVGGVCLRTFDRLGQRTVMVDGYCSRDCTNSATACHSPDERCEAQSDGIQQTGANCLKTCSDANACERSSGYTCTTGGLCWPQSE